VRRFVIAVAWLVSACGAAAPSPAVTPATESDAERAWGAWRAERREEIAGPEGWLTLVALEWLEPGEHTVGSDPSCEIVLAGAPPHAGRLVVDPEHVRFVAAPGADVRVSGAPMAEVELVTGDEASAPRLEIGSLRAYVIKRGGQRALRVRDLESPARRSFEEIPVYPYDPTLRVRAQVVVPDPPRMLALVNVLGMAVDEPCAAVLRFTLDGHDVSLAATAAGAAPDEGFFVMLRDATASTDETYPAGRYLDVPAADATGHTWVDLNFLHTPPCGYTHLATCPLPPQENVLSLAIRGGERYVPQHLEGASEP
jgi:uncharacterized protein (DUF1684 family)